MKLKNLKIKAQDKFKKKKFVFVIGDEYAILTYIVNNRLEERIYGSISVKEDMEKFQTLLAVDENSSISVLIDVSDQTYTHQTLPGVNSFTLGKIVQKKLNRDLANIELKGSICLGKLKAGKNDWNLVFVGCSINSPLKEWLEFITSQKHSLTGLYMFPIEAGELVKKLYKSYFKSEQKVFLKKLKKPELRWQLLVTHNKVGGFRQVAFYGEKIVFTRLISIPPDESSVYIAGNIEQELLNTLEYLKRLWLREGDKFDLFIIVSQEIKNNLQKVKLVANNIYILTPWEVAKQINLSNAASQEDKYGDVICAVNFATTKPVLRFITEELNKLLMFDKIKKLLHLIFGTVILLIINFIIYQGVNFLLESKKNNIILKEKESTIQKLDQVKSKAGNIEELSKISNIVNLYKVLVKNDVAPLDLIMKFADTKDRNLFIKSVSWKLKESNPVANNQNVLDDNQAKEVVVFDSEFYNNNVGYQKLFEDFDNFIKVIERNFSHYNVEYSRNTEKISFDTTIKKIPIKITISGPKEAKSNDSK